jgi:hypothetical protein
MTKQTVRGALTAAMIAAVAITCAPALAANSLPEIFQGRWQPFLDVAAGHITEVNYECDIKKIRSVKEDGAGGHTYQIDMRCTTSPPESSEYTRTVKSLWAIRQTPTGDVLVITTLPDTIQVFERTGEDEKL